MTREELIKAMKDNFRILHHREYGDPVINPDGVEIVGYEDAVQEIMAEIGGGEATNDERRTA